MLGKWVRWCRTSEVAEAIVWLVPMIVGAVLVDRLT